MQINTDIFLKCPLFGGIDAADIAALLDCLSAARHEFAKGDFVFRAEDNVESVGIVIAGSLHIIQEDFWGNRTILSQVGPAELFGEAFSCAGIDRLPVSVIAMEHTEVLLIDYRKIITTCPNSCVFHMGLIKNMLNILAGKNVMLTHKMEILSMRTIREKLLAYLSAQAIEHKSNVFDISFNRQELADYLCVDRSALSRELGRMLDEDVLWFDRNHFELQQVNENN